MKLAAAFAGVGLKLVTVVAPEKHHGAHSIKHI